MNKLISYTLALVVLINFTIPSQAAAQTEVNNVTEAEKVALIANLMEQVAHLTALLEELKANEENSDFAYTLSFGSNDTTTNGEVTRLQELLITEGVYPAGIISGFYGTLTSEAVVSLKQKYNIFPLTPIFEPSTFKTIEEIKNPTVEIKSGEFFQELIEAYEANYGYKEISLNASQLNFVDSPIVISTDTELHYDYVVDKGSVGNLFITDYVDNEHGVFGFEKAFDIVHDKTLSDNYTFLRLLSHNEENPFITKEENEDLKELVGEWLRVQNDNKTISFNIVADPEILTSLFNDEIYTIDFESRVLNADLSDQSNQVYSYDINIDLDKLQTFYEKNDLIEQINSELEITTGYKTFEEAREYASNLTMKIFVLNDRLYGLHGSYAIDFVSEIDGETTLTNNLYWITESELTEEIDIKTPSKYIKLKSLI